jgi:dienelactone hydrolase
MKSLLKRFIPTTVGAALAAIRIDLWIAAKAAPTTKKCAGIMASILLSISTLTVPAQDLGSSGHPGDPLIHEYLSGQAEQIHGTFMEGIETKEDWLAKRPALKEEYFYMLGLSPMPKKTPLMPTITGTLEMDGYVVDKLHYQSMPGLYVTANLYRPAAAQAGEKLPAILYVCGHAERGRNGNKTAYQSHGIWFARHGYLCLMVDTIQRGEIKGIHHGTYRYNRWWWQARGYTPSGVECWNGIRGIDYLISRADVDPDRIGVTGISGGGAVTFWVAAADDRVKVAIPVSGMADLPSYLEDHVINGHCDCMFFYNTYQWPWTRIAALIAPRPLFFVNSHADPIFPMNANERVSNRLERFYSLFGAGDQVETLVSIGGHAYREDIRRATFRFMNMHFKKDPSPVTDSEVDIVSGPYGQEVHPIPPEQLRVFPTDADIPTDEINSTIDQQFVPMATVDLPKNGQFKNWKSTLIAQLREVTFRSFPDRIPAARVHESLDSGKVILDTGEGMLSTLHKSQIPASTKRIHLFVSTKDSPEFPAEFNSTPDDAVYTCLPRGTGAFQWTAKNPPNYVARSFPLLGRTVADARIWDIIATARYLKGQHGNKIPLILSGHGPDAVLAAYAMLLESDIDEGVFWEVPASHMEKHCPPLLNVLRVCDLPDVMGALAPRALTLRGIDKKIRDATETIYASAEAKEHLIIK